jgi:hypothetical protein
MNQGVQRQVHLVVLQIDVGLSCCGHASHCGLPNRRCYISVRSLNCTSFSFYGIQNGHDLRFAMSGVL